MLFAVRFVNQDGTTTFAGKEGFNRHCEEPEWVGTERQASAKAKHWIRERNTKPNKSLTFTKVEVVPIKFEFGDPIEVLA